MFFAGGTDVYGADERGARYLGEREEARMEKNKKKHQLKFVYYRLQQGIKNLLAGVKRMFLFRWKRRARKALLKTIPSGQPVTALQSIPAIPFSSALKPGSRSGLS